jgi:hypothetical protein
MSDITANLGDIPGVALCLCTVGVLVVGYAWGWLWFRKENAALRSDIEDLSFSPEQLQSKYSQENPPPP